MAPIHDDPSPPSSSPLVSSPFDALADCEWLAIGPINARDERAVRAALKSLQSAATAKKRSIDTLVTAIDAAVRAFEAAKTADPSNLAEKLDPLAREDERFVPAAGWAWTIAGRTRYQRDEMEPAVDALVRGEELLARLDDSVGRNRYTVALRYHALALAKTDADTSFDLLRRIVELSISTGDAHIRNRALTTTNDLAQDLHAQRPAETLAICERALSLDRSNAVRLTWHGVLDCNNSRALTLRKLGRLDEAVTACERTVEIADEQRLDDDITAEIVAWALCEGAFVAAELAAQPDRALRFVGLLRARAGVLDADTDEAVLSELAYAISMEARASLSKEQPEKAVTACDEAIALVSKLDTASSRGAHAAALRVRGQALSALGRLDEARADWTRAVEAFIDDEASAVRDEAIRARALLLS
ncbi:MAG: hypothetical protein U0269_14500 [Polyangiales bacterium]